MDLVEKNRILEKNRSHRAVAPIIATLILVAIAVVGGVMIFTFSQGFFGEQQVSTTPTSELMTMVGYDARKVVSPVVDLAFADGNSIGYTSTVALTTVATYGNGEAVAVYVRNGGEQDITIANVQALGNGASDFNGCGGDLGPTSPGLAGFCMAVAGSSTNVISPGEVAGISWLTGTETVNPGRTFEIKVTTDLGSVFDFKLVANQRS